VGIIEFMNTHLALTISPPNRMKGTKLRNYNRFLYEEDILHIRAVFKYNKINSFIIFPEFDDKGRLHYHGTVTLNTNQLTRWHKHAECKLRLMGFIDYKPLRGFLDRLRWIFYCRKDFWKTKEVLDITGPALALPKERIRSKKHNLDTDELKWNIKVPRKEIKDFFTACDNPRRCKACHFQQTQIVI